MKPYRFHEDADSEFLEWTAYYDAQAEGLGDRFVEAVAAAVVDIRTYPEIGPLISRNVRRRVVRAFAYNLLYINLPEELLIVAVAPQKRRPGYWRKRLRRLPR